MREESRPSPDDLLSLADEESKKAGHGKLKIFFGSSAGVGKTYSMLSAAQELRAQGLDTVIGIIETHQRPHTEELAKDIPIINPIAIPYRGLLINELDLDKALTLKPHTVLVDELAHTNTPGSRHPKRWNDVMELLDAGINVFTTLNVQHIESLSDLIASTTGVWVKETVPDSIFDMADDIVLVDIDSDDLLKRLHEGNVYVAPGANRRAADNFFKKENLNALRQIALRRTAERVDAERDPLHETLGRAPVSDKILVCVGPDKHSAKLIRSAKRMASALKTPWTALYIEKGDPQSQTNKNNRSAIELLERMVSRLDGKMVTLHGDDLHDEIMSYAKKNKITKIIVGKSNTLSVHSFFDGLLVNRIIKSSGNIDVIVVTEDPNNPDLNQQKHSALTDLRPLNYLISFLVVVGFTIPGLYLSSLITSTDQALLYLAGIVLVAENLGLGPALFYALLAASSFNIFFASSHYFHVTDERAYLMTFLVMLITGFAVARQSSRLKTQAISSRIREERMRALYELTQKLTASRGRFPVSEVISAYLTKTHDVIVTIWMTNQEGHLSAIVGDIPETSYYKDFGALQWCFESSKNAGHGTSTMPSASGLYLPLTTSDGAIGVLGIIPQQPDRIFTFDEVSSMETLASLLASALERVRAGEIAQQVVVENENKKLRASLLSAFSDKPDAPFQAIQNSISSLLSNKSELNAPDISEKMVLSFNEHAHHLKNIVGQIIDINSLESGTYQTNRLPSSLLERIKTSIERAKSTIQRHPVRLTIPSDIPDVLVDAELIEQLIINLLENASRFSPPEGEITISAIRKDGAIFISVEDEGTGFPDGTEAKIFDKFFALSDGQNNKSFGLGLTISAGIVRLHGGRIWAENRPTGGAKITFSLPLA
ncbi:MAG: sensor histidine kinase KdpD [Alphaproteobacteria bacterium]|nr:sensor histidine kinase KdpD [Alphaproteobacteria bacterium]